MTEVVKDLTVATWVQNWDPKGGRSVTNFLNGIDAAAELGNLTDKDKVRLVLLKMQGSAQTFVDGHPDIGPDITFAALRRLLIDRFKDKHTDYYFYTQLQSAKQELHESPEDFADRLRSLSKNTIRTVDSPQGQAALNDEAERRLVAIFINGLRGNPGLQVKYQMPDTMEKAVKIAMITAQAEREKEQLKPSPKLFWCEHMQDIGHVQQGNKQTLDFAHKSGYVGSNTRGKRNFRGSNQRGNNRNNYRRGIQCYVCREIGHKAKDCKKYGQEGRPQNLNGVGRR